VKPILVKIGGSCLDTLSDLWWDDLAAIAGQRKLIVVHGWSRPLERYQRNSGREPKFLVDQYGFRSRWTDTEVLDDILQVSALARQRIAFELAKRRVPVLGVNGPDTGLLRATVRPRLWWMEKKLVPLQNLVGPVVSVNAKLIEQLMCTVDALAISPLATSPEHPLVNTDADRAATQIALALKLDSMVFATDVAGLLVDGTLRAVLSSTEWDGLKQTIKGGMAKKVRSAFEALAGEVTDAWIGNASVGDLLNCRSGTHVVRA